MIIRPATTDDRPAIAEFTEGTFEWGDYVGDQLPEWLASPDGHVIVAVDHADRAIALARGILLSKTELWLHAARVHPDHRGEGIAGDLNDHLVAWGRERDAQVVRLLIEDWNEAAQRQVKKSGYRSVSDWVYGRRIIASDDPNPTRNGGKRVPGPERLQTAGRSEVEPAFLAWSTSDFMRTARGLFGRTWRWRRLTIEDLSEAATNRTFFECPSGWVIMDESAGGIEVSWMMATPEDTRRLVRGVLDYALAAKAADLRFHVPDAPGIDEALARIGCDISRSSVWERAVDL